MMELIALAEKLHGLLGYRRTKRRGRDRARQQLARVSAFKNGLFAATHGAALEEIERKLDALIDDARRRRTR